MIRRRLAVYVVATLLGALSMPVWSLTADQALAMVSGDNDARVGALQKAVANADEKTAQFLQALSEDAVKVSGKQVWVVREGKAFDPVTLQVATTPLDEGAEEVVSNNRMRSEIDSALAALQLFSADVHKRRTALLALQAQPDPAQLPLVEKALLAEQEEAMRAGLLEVQAMLSLAHADPARRMQAVTVLAKSASPSVKKALLARLSKTGKDYAEPDAQIRNQLQLALREVEGRLVWGERLGLIFSGLSLGSILLLVALGLAITYGLMGVINMAHGELMMVGAYAAYVVQGFFRQHLPSAFDYYLLAAVPASFLVAAVVGAVLERLIIRHLYGRPLETLLATWGISLMLMQGVRSLFGAQNVQVENPVWMSGGWSVLSNLSLPYNRLVIIAFALSVLFAVALLMARTRLGLFVRGVTQNRGMAACMGVNTARVDTYAFALGSGIAGLAGCALSQIGNVGPDLGQSYIVDAFMVVVLGGVGQLAGTVVAGLGLGVLNKLLEGIAGAVLAKIAVLVLIVVFIQKRPQGLFALKGRSVEA